MGVTGGAIACFFAWAGPGRAEEFRVESVGVRGGISANGARNEFHQAEFFGNWNLPWGWDLGKEWHLQSRLDLSAGWLGDSSHNAAVGSLGPTLVLGRAGWPVSLEGGFSPTLLSSYAFESKSLGTDIQFTSHVGLNWDFAAHWRLGYRFQHMSNADLSTVNPGLNMHMFALSYVF
ncbi:MAG: acyloxyacyl hydrolase [Limisphaerales bacterium]